MFIKSSVTGVAAAVCAMALGGAMSATQQAPPAGQRGAPGAGGAGGVAAGFFSAMDADKDGALTRAEMKATFDRWFSEWDTARAGSLSQEQLLNGVNSALPQPAGGGLAGGRGAAAQNQTPQPEHVAAMVASLPATAPVKPKQPRRVLVLGRFRRIRALVDPAGSADDRRDGQEDRRVVDHHHVRCGRHQRSEPEAIRRHFPGEHHRPFLDDPNDAAATAARRKALLDFVRGGKGLAGIDAATDSYHQNAPSATPPPAGAQDGRAAAGGRARRRPRRPRRGGDRLVTQLLAQGDTDRDQQLSRAEFTAIADAWFDKIDTGGAGRVTQADFPQRFAAVMPPPAPAAPPVLGATGFPVQPAATQLGPDTQLGTWPEFNKMIGGFFKFHWNDGQLIHYKIDEPNHPLNAPFKGQRFPGD